MPLACLLTILSLRASDRCPIQLEVCDLDAELLGILEVIVDFGVVQQHLRGDAADVQAGAAQRSRLSR